MDAPKRKLVIGVFGDMAVGKTALIHQVSLLHHLVIFSDLNKFLLGRFLDEHVHTETDLWHTHIHVLSELVDLFIIDTAEAPSEAHLQIDGAIGVFSSASITSFVRLAAFSPWFDEFNQTGGFVALVGTHADIDRQEVRPDQVHQLADKIRARPFMLCTKADDQARSPWDALLRQITWRAEPVAAHLVETPRKWRIGFIELEWRTWHHLLGSISGCLGIKN